jgi:hypothetical protein
VDEYASYIAAARRTMLAVRSVNSEILINRRLRRCVYTPIYYSLKVAPHSEATTALSAGSALRAFMAAARRGVHMLISVHSGLS